MFRFFSSYSSSNSWPLFLINCYCRHICTCMFIFLNITSWVHMMLLVYLFSGLSIWYWQTLVYISLRRFHIYFQLYSLVFSSFCRLRINGLSFLIQFDIFVLASLLSSCLGGHVGETLQKRHNSQQSLWSHGFYKLLAPYFAMFS